MVVTEDCSEDTEGSACEHIAGVVAVVVHARHRNSSRTPNQRDTVEHRCEHTEDAWTALAAAQGAVYAQHEQQRDGREQCGVS